MKRQPVGDVDDDGKYQLSWLWGCSECPEQAIYRAQKLPPGWRLVGEEKDIETSDAVCPDCAEEGYGGDEAEVERLPGLEITGDEEDD